MHDLNQIRKMNEVMETQKSQARARAMNNNPSGHPKDAEKGWMCKRCNGAGRVLKVSGPPFPVVAVKCPDCT